MGIERIKIARARDEDLKRLNKSLFWSAVPDFHVKKLGEQKKGGSFWFIAWIKNTPVGHIQLILHKTKIKGIAHIEALGVKGSFREKGIGSQLIDFVEESARKKGYNKVGLSVENNNLFLRMFYLKRGYKIFDNKQFIESWEEIDDKGNKKQVKEKCVYLIKNLK